MVITDRIVPHSSDDDMGDIAPEERREILAQIDQLVLADPERTRNPEGRYAAQRSGIGFPVLVNLFSVAVFGVGALLLLQVFQTDRVDSDAGGSRGAIAEQLVIEEIRRASQEELSAREEEITAIRARLATVASERRELETQMETGVAERVRLLEAERDASISDERASLASMGLTGAQVQQRIDRFSATLEAQLLAETERIRTEAEREATEAGQELDAREAEYRRSLNEAMEERNRVLVAAEAEIADLREQHDQELRSQAEALQGVRRDLAELRSAREQADLVSGQIRSAYGAVGAAFVAQDFSRARADLSTLQQLLQSDRPAIVAMGEQRQTELFIVEALQELIDYEERTDEIASEDDGVSAEERTRVDTESLALVRDGNRALERGRWLEAIGSFSQVADTYHFGAHRTDAVDGMVRTASLMSARIAQLETEWHEANQRALQAQRESDNARQAAPVAPSDETLELRRRLEEADRDNRSLRQQLSATDADRESLRQRVAVLNDELASLRNASGPGLRPGSVEEETLAELERLRMLERDVIAAQMAYASFLTESNRTSRASGGADSVRSAYSAFLSHQMVNRVFPGIAETVTRMESAPR
jgi:hypothetical protein